MNISDNDECLCADFLPSHAPVPILKGYGNGQPSADDAHRREQEAVQDKVMLESLPTDERIEAIVGKNPLAETLARIGRLIDDRAVHQVVRNLT